MTGHLLLPLYVGALETLDKEIVPNLPPAAASVDYRKSLAISLFYKVWLDWFAKFNARQISRYTNIKFCNFMQFYLSAIPEHLSARVQSAAVPYIRPVSQGQQVFTPDTAEFPAGQPMTKLTAKLQVCV